MNWNNSSESTYSDSRSMKYWQASAVARNAKTNSQPSRQWTHEESHPGIPVHQLRGTRWCQAPTGGWAGLGAMTGGALRSQPRCRNAKTSSSFPSVRHSHILEGSLNFPFRRYIHHKEHQLQDMVHSMAICSITGQVTGKRFLLSK